MLNIGGELACIIQDINYKNKFDLLNKLRDKRTALAKSDTENRELILSQLNIAIQQVFYLNNEELLNYKSFIRNNKEQNKNQEEKWKK